VIRIELRRARIRAKLTQQQLAAKAGLSRHYISLIESGSSEPSLSVFVRLCQAMGADPAAVLRRALKK